MIREASALTARDRLVFAVAHATGTAPELGTAVWSMLLAEAEAMRAALVECVGPDRAVVVTGTPDRRLVMIEHDDGEVWTVSDRPTNRTARVSGHSGHRATSTLPSRTVGCLRRRSHRRGGIG